jgi:outer membrane protein assembly factor BamD (BamD/ComL family)
MSLRALSAAFALLSLVRAPYQCGRSEDPAERREETAPEALYAAAGKLREAGDERGYHMVLALLIERYPSSRWAEAARLDLGADGGVRDAGR